MPIPLKTSVFWAVYRRVEPRAVMQQPADKVRAASNLRKRLLGLAVAAPITGRTDRRVSTTDIEATLPDGTVLPLRVYRPRAEADAPLPVVVNFHGGGWVSGDVRQSQWWASSVAAEAGVVVVSPEYRLAPEHPFPVPPDDCFGATQWVADNAAGLDVDAARLAVMGDSAGGNLAAVVSLMARDRGGPEIALQILIYPSVDLSQEFPSEQENADAPILQLADHLNIRTLYLQGADPAEPYASPLQAKHDGLPPALVQTAQHDLLRDHGTAYAAALRAAGVEVRLTNYIDAVHGYISLPGLIPASRQALAETVATIRQYLLP